MTPWDIVLALCIVLGVFLLGRTTGYERGLSDGMRVERRRRGPPGPPPTRPV